MALERDDGEQDLCGGDYPSNGMDCELLNRAVDRCLEILRLDLLLALRNIVGKSVCFSLGLGKLAVQSAMEFGDSLGLRFGQRCNARDRLAQPAPLDDQILLLFDELLLGLQVL